jgi:hypothetical protein
MFLEGVPLSTTCSASRKAYRANVLPTVYSVPAKQPSPKPGVTRAPECSEPELRDIQPNKPHAIKRAISVGAQSVEGERLAVR